MTREELKSYLLKVRDRNLNKGGLVSGLHIHYNVPEDNYLCIPQKDYDTLLAVTYRLGQIEQHLYGEKPKWPSELENDWFEVKIILEKVGLDD